MRRRLLDHSGRAGAGRTPWSETLVRALAPGPVVCRGAVSRDASQREVGQIGFLGPGPGKMGFVRVCSWRTGTASPTWTGHALLSLDAEPAGPLLIPDAPSRPRRRGRYWVWPLPRAGRWFSSVSGRSTRYPRVRWGRPGDARHGVRSVDRGDSCRGRAIAGARPRPTRPLPCGRVSSRPRDAAAVATNAGRFSGHGSGQARPVSTAGRAPDTPAASARASSRTAAGTHDRTSSARPYRRRARCPPPAAGCVSGSTISLVPPAAAAP